MIFISKFTENLKVKGEWLEVLNDCRSTVSKDPLAKEPSEGFKKKILIAEHSPIREMSIKWVWPSIKSWVATHWVRHKWECFVSTQRTDRTGVNRDELPQSAPVKFTGDANIQALIDTAKKRLCYQAAQETREYMEDLKCAIHEVEPEIADVLVPNCVYRCGCPEKMGAPCEFFKNLNENNAGYLMTDDIQERYDIYNDWFYKHKGVM